MKYIIETGDMRQVIETPLDFENYGPQLFGLALDESKYSGGLGALFSITPVPSGVDPDSITDTVEDDSTVFMKTEYALRELGRWSDE